MYHRYGRHGPHAWLRWYRRHYTRPATSLVPVVRTKTTIYVYNPSSTERIIVIVAENLYNDESSQLTPRPLEIAGKKVPELLSGDLELRETAQVQAINDAETLQGIARSGGSLSIHRIRIAERARRFAQKDVMEYLTRTGHRKPEEYKRLLDVYQQAYTDQLDQEIKERPNIKHIDNPQDAHLREVARQDRKTYPTYTSRRFHQRDLAVIRVLSVLNLYIDSDISDALLETIHDFADTYEDYFRNQEEEVEWPPQEPFLG